MLNMRIHKKKMLREIHHHHSVLNEVRAIVEALPDELPDGVIVYAGNWAVYLDIPYDWEMYRQVRRCLRGWIATGVYTDESTGDKFYVLRPQASDRYNSASLYIALKPSMKQSNCRVEVVGKREVDVVKVVCEGGK